MGRKKLIGPLPKLKMCIICKEIKDNYKDFRTYKGILKRNACKQCETAYMKGHIVENYEKQKQIWLKSYYKNRNHYIKYRREHRKKTRDLVFEKYGNVCQCCGEWRNKFLSLDHINNDGNAHRKDIGGGGRFLYHWAVKNGFPKTLRLLCFNCNMGRHLNGGKCPHEEEKIGLVANSA